MEGWLAEANNSSNLLSKNMKIAIGIPTNRQFRPLTVLSLANLVSYTRGLGHELFITIPTEGFNTAENRNFTVAQAIKNNCSHILFSDDDMTYPEDALVRLLSHDKDIIGALYSVRRQPPALVIEYKKDSEIVNDEQAKSAEKIFECEAIGTGLMLVKTEVFKKIQSPFFGYEWYSEVGMVKTSTDWFFCKKLKEAGIKIWADPLIKNVGHLGEFNYEY